MTPESENTAARAAFYSYYINRHGIEPDDKGADRESREDFCAGYQAAEDHVRADYAPIRAMVDAQAEDDGLWFVAQTAAEAYLQQELRKLHVAIEARIKSGER